ncbi:MAG: PEGA domain-containing protein [Spirochaetales bacterium]|nr:PEGA domain-containing protein [Spirochaetales bacterium]
MKRIILGILVSIFSVTGLFSQPDDKQINVAVINFENQTGSNGLGYLSSSLADSLSATLSQNNDISIVERGQLEKIMDEVKLELSGIMKESNLSSFGELVKANVLLIGSYTGDPQKIVVNLKAVDVGTAKILYGRVITAPLSTLFDIITQASLEMGTIIAGEDIGTLSVTTVPDGSDIYINGMLAGKSPLVEYKVPCGRIRLKSVKTGYMEEDSVIDITPEIPAVWSIVLKEAQNKYPWHVSLSAFYLQPINNPLDDTFKPSLLLLATLGYSFSNFSLDAELGFSKMDHSETIDFFGTSVEQKRWYNYATMNLNFKYFLFPGWKYISPWLGILAGGSVFTDIRENSSGEEGEEELMQQGMVLLGANAGVNFFSFSRFQPYLEGRFYYYPQQLTRTAYSSAGLGGGLIAIPEDFIFFGFAIGCGIRVTY